ncbi:DUF72 domain-containing protein [Atrimonas thermophila]|uniref:DUF72 domain-containing protein n=1 Tax=Atrimonas thermophila TaxID=3064161 RepID=UPI00399D53D1
MITKNQYFIGTCSWTDKTLLESGFYPKQVKSSEQRLRYYAARFNTVEIDSIFYALPSLRNVLNWIERTPQDFLFGVKAFSLFTVHQTPWKTLPLTLQDALPQKLKSKDIIFWKECSFEFQKEVVHYFSSLLLPMLEAGKLGYLLFQLPPWFSKTSENMEHLSRLRESFAPFPIAIEFRNRSWLKSKEEARHTFSFLRKNQMSYVAVDEPQLPWTVPPMLEVTSPTMVIRFHGRNSAAWQKKNATVWERFNYFYTREELSTWSRVIQEKSKSANPERIFVMFNNCFRDYAIRNAQMMQELLFQNL